MVCAVCQSVSVCLSCPVLSALCCVPMQTGQRMWSPVLCCAGIVCPVCCLPCLVCVCPVCVCPLPCVLCPECVSVCLCANANRAEDAPCPVNVLYVLCVCCQNICTNDTQHIIKSDVIITNTKHPHVMHNTANTSHNRRFRFRITSPPIESQHNTHTLPNCPTWQRQTLYLQSIYLVALIACSQSLHTLCPAQSVVCCTLNHSRQDSHCS